ncbi:macro domain-containing protein [uncultured Mesotoga sp.]|uniref:macro domain-containing protein n=1 Tax=uncultured Mesotoga sp. TaxID=1184400 RepID=UPI0025953DB5|nr:macro domain-containing protein [uncultured Mesotoga sp.]
MITVYQKSVFAAFEEENVPVIANTVNTKGVMGAGLALEFKLRFPSYFDNYRERCSIERPVPGSAWIFREENSPAIISLFVKEDWKMPSKISWIRSSLKRAAEIITESNFERVALPLAGAGKGGIDPQTSENITREVFEGSKTEILLCLDKTTSKTEESMIKQLRAMSEYELKCLTLRPSIIERLLEKREDVTRFREILDIRGIGIKTYSLLFNALISREPGNDNQLNLF